MDKNTAECLFKPSHLRRRLEKLPSAFVFSRAKAERTTVRSAWKTGDLLDRQQQLAGLDRLTALDKDLVDRAVHAGDDARLHLHGLDHGEHVVDLT